MTNTGENNEFRQKLQLLKEEYIKHIPQELHMLEELAKKLVSTEDKKSIARELHIRLHKITGSAGTFGLSKLSELARPIELQLKDFESNTGHISQALNLKSLCDSIISLKNNLEDIGNSIEVVNSAIIHNKSEESRLIWLVEDDILLGEVLARQIQSFGYVVKLFQKIGDLNLAIKKETPDLMILDVFFEVEGVNTTEVIQLLPELSLKDCAIIFMSAVDDFDSRIRAAQLNADGFFIKPLDVPSLMNNAAHIFQRKNSPPKKVLIIDDDTLLAQHYCLTLKSAGIDAKILEHPRKIMQTFAFFRPELILMDLYMPDYSGHDLAGVIRQHENWASVPIIFLSSETDLDKQNKAMEFGGDDFLTKPISNSQLVAAVNVRIDRFRELDSQIKRDSLTGLLKHASIKESVVNEVSRNTRSKTPLSVAMIDIDNFKMVNDQYGHATGDLVICSIAMLLKQRLRQHDVIGRYGGEEFLVALPDCDCQSAFEIMEDIRERFESIRFSNKNITFYNSISIGIACNSLFAECTADKLLHAADKALYKAKNSGRNQVKVSTQTSE